MLRFSRRRVVALAIAGVLLLGLLPAGLVHAAPQAPAFTVSDLTPQAGPYDSTSNFNAGWFVLQITNNGSSSYTQLTLTVVPDDPTVVPRAALDATHALPTSTSLCAISGNGFLCTWPGSLNGGQSTVPIRFVFSAPAGNSYNVTATVSSKDETNTGDTRRSDRGTSQVVVSMEVTAGDGAGTAFVPPATTSTVSAVKQGTNNRQRASLLLPSSGAGYLTVLEEFLPGQEPAGIPGVCAAITGGIGQLVSAQVNQGVRVSPYLQWTVEINFAKGVVPPPATGVLHCTIRDGVFVLDEITVTESDRCPTDGSPVPEKGCLVWNGNAPYAVTVVGPPGNPSKQEWTYVFVVRTTSNYLLKPKAS